MRIGGNHDLQNWGGRTRTYNFLINSQAICQLIYTPSNKSARWTGVWRALGTSIGCATYPDLRAESRLFELELFVASIMG